jgi:hypothetical protein
MSIKQFLNQAFYLNKLIEANKLELFRLRELAASVGSPDLSKDYVKSSGNTDKIGEIVARIVDLEDVIQADIDRYIKIKADIRALIANVENDCLRLVLQKRYLNLGKWEQIAVSMNYSVMQIWRLHGKALIEAAKNDAV